jgi:Holliday junction resolvase RusA-like endonuclease
MGKTIEIYVPAVPVAQPRARATFRGGYANVYTPSTVGTGDNKRPHPIHAFKATLRMAASDAYSGPPLSGPLRIDVLLVFPRQKNKVWKNKPMSRYPHTEKPDRDNCDKAVLDGLKGIMFVDDCQAFCGTIEKWRASGDEQPHCIVKITEVDVS